MARAYTQYTDPGMISLITSAMAEALVEVGEVVWVRNSWDKLTWASTADALAYPCTDIKLVDACIEWLQAFGAVGGPHQKKASPTWTHTHPDAHRICDQTLARGMPITTDTRLCATHSYVRDEHGQRHQYMSCIWTGTNEHRRRANIVALAVTIAHDGRHRASRNSFLTRDIDPPDVINTLMLATWHAYQAAARGIYVTAYRDDRHVLVPQGVVPHRAIPPSDGSARRGHLANKLCNP